MNRRMALGLMSLAGICCSCNTKPRDPVVTDYDEKEMDTAIARARRELNGFIDEFKKGADTGYSVKAAINDNGQIEHFWLTDIVYRDGEFEGEIGNEPEIVKNVKIGQKWRVKKDEVEDWMFMRKGKIHGNYTMRPLLRKMPKDEAKKYESLLANP